MMKRKGKKYEVFDSAGKKKLGAHDTKEAALRQIAAIEISKKRRGK